jgi:hypothetical protein
MKILIETMNFLQDIIELANMLQSLKDLTIYSSACEWSHGISSEDVMDAIFPQSEAVLNCGTLAGDIEFSNEIFNRG